MYFALVIARAFAPFSASSSVNRPLSGPTNTWPPASTHSARRALPTPGSTTQTKIVPFGK